MSEETKTRISATRRPSTAAHRFMVFGAGIYWATCLLQNTHTTSTLEKETYLVELLGIEGLFSASCLLLVALMAVVALFARRLVRPRAQKALAACAFAGCGATALLVSPLAPSSLPCAIVLLVVHDAATACSLLFWGLNFTALDKHGAERVTIESLIFALILYLLGASVITDKDALTYATQVAMMVAVLPFLCGRYRIDIDARPDATPNKKLLAPFFASRMLFGVCMGAASYLVMTLGSSSGYRNLAACLATLAAVVAFALWTTHRDEDDLTLLRFAPLITCGIVLVPFLGGEELVDDICRCVPAFIWISWIILHSVQLSALKHEAGLGDVVLSFSEKIVFTGFYGLTLSALCAVPSLASLLAESTSAGISALLVIVFVSVFVCSYQLSSVIEGKTTERIVDSALELSDQRNEPVYEDVGRRFGLTARELDVLRLIARGLTRPAICEELCISEGTARSHLDHIYKKMGVHSRDELLAILDEAVRAHVAK